MFKIKRAFVICLLVLLSLIILSACGASPAEQDPDDEAINILMELQAELAELRAENTELREEQARLTYLMEDPQTENIQTEVPQESGTAASVPPAPSEPAAGAANQTNTSQPPVVVEIHMPETPQPSPSPTPTPTPPPASLDGRWVTVGAVKDGEQMHVPSEQSFEVEFNTNGTGMKTIEGVGSSFTWTGGDTGASGRIVKDFGGFFGGTQTETMTYQIQATTLNLTHTMFGDVITTILQKAQ